MGFIKMLKMVVAILAGVICGLIVVVAGELGVGLMFPPPPGIDFTDAQQSADYIDQLPGAASVMILASWLVSAFVGGLVAGLVAERLGPNWKRASLFAGAILLAANVPNMVSVPQPMWINAVSFLFYFLLAYAGGRVVNRT